jgi:predicted amidohydrolase YtcJ
MDDLVTRLATHARSLPASEPVVATRMDDESLAERRLPTRADLDRAVPHRPAVIYRYCGHVAVANSAALQASGIDESTPDPGGGSLDRDESGVPTGVLRETAVGLIAPALARGGGLDPDGLIDGLHRLAGVGLTSVGAMLGYGESPHEKLEAEVELLASVAGDLPIRVHAFVITDDPELLARTRSRLDSSGPRLRWLGVKRFADGSLGGHTAAMHSPFADVETSGTMRLTDTDAAIARATVEMGGMVAIHAIGDRAVDETLTVFDRLIAAGANPDALRMEHVSVISPDQIQRFARAGVTASVQPAFLRSESEWVVDRVGADRAAWLYPFASMLRVGIPLAGSSDSPVEPPHPLWGIASAVGRHGITESERLTPLEALGMFTSGAARALREPRPLEPGSPADITVLDTDITRAGPEGIEAARVLDTWVEGRIVDVDRSLPTWVD